MSEMPRFATFLLCAMHFVFQVVLSRKGSGILSSNTAVRSYDFSINSIIMTDLNPMYFGPGTYIALHGPNHYSYQINILKTLPVDALSLYSSFEKNNRNEYVPSLTVRGTVCDDFEKDKKGYPMYKCEHLYDAGVHECPVKKGVYKISNASCFTSDGPIMAPGHYWKVNYTWLTPRNEVLIRRIIELTVERKIKIG